MWIPRNLVTSTISMIRPIIMMSCVLINFALDFKKKTYNAFFLTLSVNLLIFNHSRIFWISVFIVLINTSGFLPDKSMFESSANSILNNREDTRDKSFIYSGTPHAYMLKLYGMMRTLHNYPDNKVHGANMGPIWGRQDPGGPHVGPMNFAIWVLHQPSIQCLLLKHHSTLSFAVKRSTHYSLSCTWRLTFSILLMYHCWEAYRK